MPSIAAHMAVAKLLSEKLRINDDEFIKGNLLPDIINSKDSHHKIKGKYFLIPDISYFKQELDLTDKLYLGYLAHLLLDKYFLEDFLPKYTIDSNLFSNGTIYKEYDLINYQLVKRFNLDTNYLSKVLNTYREDINQEILNRNIRFLKSTNIGDTKYLKYEDFSLFLNDIVDKIYEEIEDYAS